jgi:hypothetical protein
MDRLRARPIVTGFFRPSLFNGPLPRLKPQPLHISMMIARRRRNREERGERLALTREWRDFVLREVAFEQRLARTSENGNKSKAPRPFDPCYENAEAWSECRISDHALLPVLH